MNTIKEVKHTNEEQEMLDEYGHLPFKRAGNRFAKYRHAKIYVVDDDGQRHELSEHGEKIAATE